MKRNDEISSNPNAGAHFGGEGDPVDSSSCRGGKTCPECGWIFAVGEDETKCPKCTEEPLCEATFEKWSQESPQKLVNFIDTYRDRNGRLTFAVEWAGFCRDSLDALVKLTDHESAVVREGAIMGLANYYRKFIQKDMYKLLKASNKHRQEEKDSSPGVRTRADYFYGYIAEDAHRISFNNFLKRYDYLDEEDENDD